MKKFLYVLVCFLTLTLCASVLMSCSSDSALEYTSNGDGTCYVSGFGSCIAIDVVIPPVSPDGDTVIGIGDSVFGSRSDIFSVTIPDTVKSIGFQAFASCPNLESIDIPDSVTSIGIQPFIGCEKIIRVENGVHYVDRWVVDCDKNVTEIVLNEDTVGISSESFANCNYLTSVTIPDGVMNIGEAAFWGCTSLERIVVDENNSSFRSIGGNLYTKNGKTLVKYSTGKTEVSFTIPDSVTSIGLGAFDNCTSLMNIDIPDSVTSIGDCSFSDCTSLTSVTIGNGVTSIDDYAFRDCSNLTSVTIGNGVTNIDDFAFEDCSNLTGVTIGIGVKCIGDRAFYGCDSITTVNYAGSEEDWAKISIDFGNSCLTNATINYNYKAD